MHRIVACSLLAVAALAVAPAVAPRAALAAGPNPTVVSVVPSEGLVAGGTTVTITGTDFTAPMRVRFGTQEGLNVAVIDATTLTVETPPGAPGPVDVVVEQADEPVSTSQPLVGGFTYFEVPCPVWVPRAAGADTDGNPDGFDLSLVDTGNGGVELAKLELNGDDTLLVDDDAWRPAQVIFNAAGTLAFVATVGTPFSFDSRRVWVVSVARALGDEPGEPILGTIDTGGNPYQLALSADEQRLFIADGGSWATSTPPLLPSGALHVYDVSDPAAPVIAAGSPVVTGILPVLAYGPSAVRGWGPASAFRPEVQSVGGRLVVTNTGSRSLTVVDTTALTVVDTADVSVPGGGLVQVSSSLASPYDDDEVLVATTDTSSGATHSFVYRIGAGSVTDRGVILPLAYFPVLPSPRPSARLAWPHGDGRSLVVPLSTETSLAAFNPATGDAENRTVVPGADGIDDVAFDDTTGLYWVRQSDGGWTVFSLPDRRAAAPTVAGATSDTTGIASLRVIRNGGVMAGTAASSLVLIDGDRQSSTAFQVVATVALGLDPAGGPLFPQPVSACGPARTYVEVEPPPMPGPEILDPVPGSTICVGEPVPVFTFDGTGLEFAQRVELQIGNQPDFLVGPGSRTVRRRRPLRGDDLAITINRRRWLRILRRAATDVPHPVYVRVNGLLPGGRRAWGEVATFDVCAPAAPEVLAPAEGATHSPFVPPRIVFESDGYRRFVVEFAGSDGFDGGDGVVDRARVPRRFIEPEFSSYPIPARRWARAVRRATIGDDDVMTWRIACRDEFGRRVYSEPRTVLIED